MSEQGSGAVLVDISTLKYDSPQKLLDRTLKQILADHNATACPECGQEIGWGDIAWNNGSTEYGTGYSTVEIQCNTCQHEIAHIDSWYPEISSNDELLYVLHNDWGNYV